METQTQRIRIPELPEPPVIQVKSPNGRIYKIIIGRKDDIIDCAWYVSHSGLTTEGCYRVEIKDNKIEAKPVRGLWIKDWVKLTIESDSKFTRDKLIFPDVFIKTYGEFLKYLKSERKYLVRFNNYGITVYMAHKVKTVQAEPTLTQGHLEIYQIELPDYIEFYEYPFYLYNHYIEGKIPLIHANDGIIIKIENQVEIKSNNHNPILLDPGTYLLVHPPVKKAD